MRAFVLLALCVAFAAGCASPRQDCVDHAMRDLRVLESLIDETERNIARGFALQPEPTVRTAVSLCLSPTNPLGICTTIQSDVRERPVAIDLAAERRKLRQLRAREAELRERARIEVMGCEARLRP